MSIRVKLTNGVLVPMDPLPEDWREGEQLCVFRVDEFSMNGQSGDRDNWDRRDADDWLSDEEAKALQDTLNENRRVAKEQMRKVMGLPE